MQDDDRDDVGAGEAGRDALVGGAARWAHVARIAAAALALAVYAWWVVTLPPFSGRATIVVVLTGTTAMAAGVWERRRSPRPSTSGMVGTTRAARTAESVRTVGVARWAVLASVAGAWQLVAYLQQPRTDHPTISSLTNALLDSHVTRAAALVVWIASAWGLARR
jgi:hypothetical protein